MTSTTAPHRFLAALRDRGDSLLRLVDQTRMSRSDAARWKSAGSMADLGELVIGWLNGDPSWTPAHGGGPCEETVPLIPDLTAINRGGFITDNSQAAEAEDGYAWNTWVTGFATSAVLARLRQGVDGTPLVLNACRGKVHGCGRRPWRFPGCPRDEVTSYWAGACPDISDHLWRTWWVHIEDPEPGRNDLLWPTLAAALK